MKMHGKNLLCMSIKPGITVKRMPLLLAADIGNTSVTLGLLSGDTVNAETRVSTSVANPVALESAIRRLLRRSRPDGAILGSVATPTATRRWMRAIHNATGIRSLVVHSGLDFGMRLDYPAPETLGVDRLLNASAALAAFGAPVLAIDIGTAITFDVVDGAGAFVGGLIMPGPRMMLDAMAGRTALLPLMQDIATGNTDWRAVGQCTQESMGLGVRWMIRAAIEALRVSVRRELGVKRLHCVVTGGHARPLLAGWRHGCVLDPHLTLRGLAHAWELNVKQVGKGFRTQV